MMQVSEKGANRFSWLLIIFLVVQPFLDLITSISIMYLESSITIGIVVRLLVMLLALVFIVLQQSSAIKRIMISFLSALIVIISIGFISAFFMKPSFSLFAEAQFYAKGLYFIVMIISYTLALVLLKKNQNKDLLTIIMKPIVFAMSIVGIIFVISTITGTGFSTYRYANSGSKGWFHAGNEIGAVLSICLPIVILYGIKCTKTIKDSYCWLPSLLVIFSLLILGTKVGILAVLISLVITFTFLVLNQLLNKNNNTIGKSNLLIITVMLIVISIATPYTPAFSNTETLNQRIVEKNNDVSRQELEKKFDDIQIGGDLKDGETEGAVTKATNRLIKVLLSSRDVYLVNMHQMFLAAPTIQKLFGMGYAGNYEGGPKLIEMDFLDLFYSYGIIGFFVFLLPFIYVKYAIIRNFKLYKSKLFTIEFVLITSSLLLGVGISLFSGHVLFAPAVNIYLAVLVAYLYVSFEFLNVNKKNA